MESEQAPVVQLTYEKTSCYFCNEWFDSQTFKEHIIHCGQVLEKCPNSCNALIQRKRMRSHLADCSKRTSPTNSHNGASSPHEYENRMLVLEQDMAALRSVLNEEIKQRLHLITDVGSLRKHNQISDEWIHKVGDVLTALKKCINEETSSRSADMKKCSEDISKIFHQYQAFQDWKASIAMRLDQMHNMIIDEENRKETFFLTLERKESLFRETIDAFESEISTLQKQIGGVHYEINLNSNLLRDEISKIEDVIEQKEMSLRTQIVRLEESIDSLRKDLRTKFVSYTELNAKQMKLDCEVKGMKNIVCETEEKCEKLERVISDMEKVTHETHQGLEDLEVHLLLQNKLLPIQNTRGHLIWKLGDYSAKFHEAKQYGTAVNSPLFCNKQYGYTLRLEVFLNGIGTWKGRNIIACLTVVPGEYDTLLEWPCKLQAEIILKDQAESPADAQDYVKTTYVKKKCEDYRSNQYIHIPHKILETRSFIRHDAIFFEVRVQKAKYS